MKAMVCEAFGGPEVLALRDVPDPAPPGAVLVMHSDGVVDRWRLDDYPGLRERSPQVVAATVLRDAGTRRDDACVLVARAGRSPSISRTRTG